MHACIVRAEIRSSMQLTPSRWMPVRGAFLADLLLRMLALFVAMLPQIAKVSDFGVSARLLDGATHRSTTSLGTITHMSPEVLRSGRLSKAADVYAFGIMMWEVR